MITKEEKLIQLIKNPGECLGIRCDDCPVSTFCLSDDELTNQQIVDKAQSQLDEIELDKEIEEFLGGD